MTTSAATRTCRPPSAPSVENLEGRSHELTNLTLADASVFPVCPAMGFVLTLSRDDGADTLGSQADGRA